MKEIEKVSSGLYIARIIVPIDDVTNRSAFYIGCERSPEGALVQALRQPFYTSLAPDRRSRPVSGRLYAPRSITIESVPADPCPRCGAETGLSYAINESTWVAVVCNSCSYIGPRAGGGFTIYGPPPTGYLRAILSWNASKSAFYIVNSEAT